MPGHLPTYSIYIIQAFNYIYTNRDKAWVRCR